MAMFSPFSALTAAAGSFAQNYPDQQAKAYDMMGMQALGKAFQQIQGPIAPIPGIGPQQGPQAPPPGQSSQPMQPPVTAPSPQMAAAPPMAGGAMPPGGPSSPPGGAPPGGGGMIPGGGQIMGGGPGGPPPGPPGMGPQPGMPQIDLQTMVQKINQANPGLPPQALVAALTRAAPLLSLQGKQDLAMLRQQMLAQNLDLRRESMDLRQRGLDIQERGMGLREKDAKGGASEDGTIGGYNQDAIDEAAERFRKTGTMPPGLRDRAGGNALRSAIANRAAELDKQDQVKGAEVPKRQQEFKAEQVAIQRFKSGPQGNTIRSLGVVVDHLGTLDKLADALANGNMKLFNRVAQEWARQTGSPVPTNMDTAKQIVGSEIIKALGVAGAGTAEERQSAGNAFATAGSPEQIRGAIRDVVRPLMLGQLKGLRRQFVEATGLTGDKFDKMIGEEAGLFLRGESSPAESVQDRFPSGYGGGAGGGGAKIDLPGGWSSQRVQ